jgi:hypothetical protein
MNSKTAAIDMLADAVQAAWARLAEVDRGRLAALGVEDRAQLLARRLDLFARSGVPTVRLEPRLSAELTPPVAEVAAPLRPVWECWAACRHEATAGTLPAVLIDALTVALAAISTRDVLIVMGMRLTPASSLDVDGFPPLRDTLFAAASARHGDTEALTVAARALDKHAQRSTEAYWGKPSGSVADKNARALALLESILDAATWWNVFGHFQHGSVFEARIASGHGARWGQTGTTFIGFLEPFAEDSGGVGP